MELYLLRHAPAGVRDPRRYPSDPERPLTRKGKLKMVLAARGLRTLGLEFDLILTSPLVRARQTARIVRSVLRAPARVRLFRPLSPGVEPESVVHALADFPAAKRLILVGHEPGLSQLAGFLLAGKGSGVSLALKKGGLCGIDFEGGVSPGAGRLIFHLTPRVLRLLGSRSG
jgi:phosphohistidine phosphatase